MRFLLIGNLTPAVAAAVERHKHTVVTPESLNLATDSPKEDLIKAANKAQTDIITADPEIADAPFKSTLYFQRSLVYLQLQGGEVEQDDAIDRLFARYKSPAPKRLYTVTETRVKVRQLPGAV